MVNEPRDVTQPTAGILVGREPEVRTLDQLSEVVATGHSESLVLVGGPGIGKTRLLDRVGSSGVTVVRLAGIESECSIAFGGLHRLLLPFRHHFAALPEQQRDALLTTFGALDKPEPSRFLVGIAALSVLALAAKDSPFVCLVDDAQWLDRDSLEILGFAARRLCAERFGFVFAARETHDVQQALRGLTTCHLSGLDRTASYALLSGARPGPLSSVVAARVCAETEGNPLAMLELLGQLTSEQRAGRLPLPQQLPTGRGFNAHFLRQLELLSPGTRALLVVASAMTTDDPSMLWRAAALLGLPEDAADGAEDLNVMRIGESVTFRHPLIRSAVYHAAEPRQRRRAHSVLATVATLDHDPDLAAWHRAAATTAPDEDVAAGLERSAARAERRGGQIARARFLARAAELSPAPNQRNERTIGAAKAYLAAGDGILAEALLDKAAPWIDEAGSRIDVKRMRALVAMFHHRGAEACEIFWEAISDADHGERELIKGMLLEAMLAALGSGDGARGVTAKQFARKSLDFIRDRAASTSAHDLLLEGFATRLVGEYAQSLPVLRDAVSTLFADDVEPLDEHAPHFAGWFAADDIWDDEGRTALFARGVTQGRRHGVPSVLHMSLAGQCISFCWAGEMDSAEHSCFEAAEVAATAGLPGPAALGPMIHLRAWQGRENECRENAGAAATWGKRSGSLNVEMFAWSGLIVLEMGLGNYREALECAVKIYENDTVGSGSIVLPEVVEAAARVGDTETAERALERLAERAEASATPWALGMLARSKAILAAAPEAEGHYLTAIGLLVQTSLRVEVARTHLLYGQWLRRQKRRRDAQDQLSTSYVMFESMGVAAFAARASAELLAAGHRVESLEVERNACTSLTPQEAHVAHRAASGATNSEIAVQMFLTTSTVEYHLSKVYRKLNITSRRQLTGQLR